MDMGMGGMGMMTMSPETYNPMDLSMGMEFMPNDLLFTGGAAPATATNTANMGNTGVGKKRVRIALKSLPQEGGVEGGEWEVQIC